MTRVSVTGGGVAYISSASYNAQEQLTALTSGNGLTRQFDYNANTQRLTDIHAGTASPWTNLQDLDYTYDNVGNMLTLTDHANSSQVQTFGYDWLDRLTSASTNAAGAGQYNHTYSYDASGNLTNYNGNAYTYSATQPHAVTAAYGNSYSYDANGNQTSRTIGGVTYALDFDYQNRLTQFRQGATVIGEFVYDVDGVRVVGTVNSATTVYIDGVYEYQGGASTNYYAGPNGLVAFRRSGYGTDNGLFYLLQDHLKSTSVLANSDGTLNARNYYYPYGDNRGGAQSALTTKRFTGQYHEAGIGLYDYNARWYDPKLARFVSADTVTPDPENPQALNKYAYTLGNPLRFSDPSGHCATTITDPNNSNEVAQFRECWKRASQISVMYDNDPWFAKRFRVSRSEWITNIAMNPSTDSEWMQTQLDAWWFDFTLRTGLPHPDRPIKWHEPPPHPLEVTVDYCQQHDCIGQSVNAVGTSVSLIALGVCVTSGPACESAAAIGSGIGILASGAGVANTAVRVQNGDASEMDLAVATGTFVVGASGPFARPFHRFVSPAMSAAASLFQAIWDNRDDIKGLPYE